MSYREKTAWLYLIAIVITFGPYFTLAALQTPLEQMPDLRQLGLFAITTIAQMLIVGIGHLYLRFGSPQEARFPPDERDQAISSRSITWAYYVLISGMILVGCVMPFTSGGWNLINTALLMIVLAEIVHYGITVFHYRRQT
jgi:hypothetical protein